VTNELSVIVAGNMQAMHGQPSCLIDSAIYAFWRLLDDEADSLVRVLYRWIKSGRGEFKEIAFERSTMRLQETVKLGLVSSDAAVIPEPVGFFSPTLAQPVENFGARHCA